MQPRVSRSALLVAAACLGFEALMIARPLRDWAMTDVNEGLLALSGFTAAWFGSARSKRESGRQRTGWQWVARGCFTYGVGQAAFPLQQHLAPGLPAGLTPGDALFVIALVLAAFGLVRLADTAALTTRVVTALDGLVIAVAILYVGWAAFLGPVYRLGPGAETNKVATLIYVAGSLVLTALVLVVAMRWPGDLHTLGLLGVAFAWVSMSDAAYALETARGTYVTGDTRIDIGWFASFLLIALAAARPSVGTVAGSLRRRWLLTLVVPYLAIAVVAVTTVALVAVGRRFDVFLQGCGIAVVLLVIVRQLTTLLEHHSLTLDLEQRVEERSRQVREGEARLGALLQNSSDVIALLDDEGRLSYVSPAAAQVLGYQEGSLVGRGLLDVIHPVDRANAKQVLATVTAERLTTATLACRLRRADGSWSDVEATLSPMRGDPSLEGTVINLRDVTERAALQDELRRQASYDGLTTLANRRLFHERVRHALDRAQRTGEELGLLFVDLDHFKRVNDTAGHSMGDEVLVQVAERLRACLRPADTAARLGGDEFAVLLEGVSDQQAAEVAARIVDALAPTYLLADRTVRVTASVGVATCAGGVGTSETLLRDADVAMYQAKAHGRGQFSVFHPTMHHRLIEQMELETGLRAALAEGGLALAYQPLIDLRTGEVTGVEALLRWPHGPEGAVPPALFIPLAEERGLIHELDMWVLREAALRVRSWHARYPRHRALRVNVNLSAVELKEAALVEEIAQIIDLTGLPAECLMLEITETAVLPDPDLVLGVLERLHDLGVGLSLDDFGTGYASLAALRRFPLDEIKIDRSFVEGLDTGPSGRDLVRAIIAMADALDLRTVAEAVETADQLSALRALHCRTAQGFLFCPPQPPEELERLFALGLAVLEPTG